MKTFVKNNIILVLVQIIFAILVLTFVSTQGFWHDEFHTLAFIQGIDVYPFYKSDFNEIRGYNSVGFYKNLLNIDTFVLNFKRNIIHEGHPPLYYILLKGWSLIFGYNELGLRSFSIFTSVITLAVFQKIITVSSTNKYYIILLASSPLFIYFSLEARSYSLYLLLSTLCIYYFLIILRSTSSNIYNLIYFSIYSTLLLYTHYYGLFVISSLSAVLLISFFIRKEFKSIILLFFPIILFTPWIGIINQQTSSHKVHWTDGALGIVDSISQYFSNSITLISVPNINNIVILIFLICLSIIIIGHLKFKNRKKEILQIGLVVFILLGVQIIYFDILMDHHTISIPRYYLPLQVLFLTLIIYLVNENTFKTANKIILISLVGYSSYHSFKIIKGDELAKQSFRELAYYIDENFDPTKKKIIIAPHGPSTLGLAYYLNEEFSIKGIPTDQICSYYKQDSLLIIEQKLGVNTEPWNITCDRNNLIKTNFIGIDLVRKK